MCERCVDMVTGRVLPTDEYWGCADCGVSTAPAPRGISEYYMLRNDVWEQTGDRITVAGDFASATALEHTKSMRQQIAGYARNAEMIERGEGGSRG